MTNQTVEVSLTNNDSETGEACLITGVSEPFDVTLDIVVSGYITSILNVIFAITAILTNVLIILGVLKNEHLRQKSANIIICCLATTDISVGLISEPMFVARRILAISRGKQDCLLSVIYNNLSSVFSGCSLSLLPVISLERYLAVAYPIKHRAHVSSDKTLYAILVAWGIIVIVSFQVYIGGNYTSYSISVTVIIVSSLLICITVYVNIFYKIHLQLGRLVERAGDEHTSPIAKSRDTLTEYVNALPTPEGSSDRAENAAARESMQYKKSKSREEKMSNLEPQLISYRHLTEDASLRDNNLQNLHFKTLNVTDNSAARHGTFPRLQARAHRLLAQQAREARLSKNMAIIIGAMIICYTPSMLAFMLNDFIATRTFWWETVFPWTDTFLFMNSSLNPFLYCWKNKDLRKAVVKLLRKLRKPFAK